MADPTGSAVAPPVPDGLRPDPAASRRPRRRSEPVFTSRRDSELARDPRIRPLGAADAAAFQALRLEALARCPSAFSAAHEEELPQSLGQVQARLREETVLGAFIDGELCGMAGFRRPAQAKKRHKGTLWGVYVSPGIRREGLGRALVAAVIAHARGEVAQLHAAVVTSNHTARRLYRGLGFVPYGIEPGGLRVGEEDFDQELLVLRFAGASARS